MIKPLVLTVLLCACFVRWFVRADVHPAPGRKRKDGCFLSEVVRGRWKGDSETPRATHDYPRACTCKHVPVGLACTRGWRAGGGRGGPAHSVPSPHTLSLGSGLVAVRVVGWLETFYVSAFAQGSVRAPDDDEHWSKWFGCAMLGGPHVCVCGGGVDCRRLAVVVCRNQWCRLTVAPRLVCGLSVM